MGKKKAYSEEVKMAVIQMKLSGESFHSTKKSEEFYAHGREFLTNSIVN